MINYSLTLEKMKLEITACIRPAESDDMKKDPWSLNVIETRYLAAEDGTLSGKFSCPADGLLSFTFDNKVYDFPSSP